MSIGRQLEREEEQLEADYNNGRISLSEYNRNTRDLQRDARDAMREAEDEAVWQAREREGW